MFESLQVGLGSILAGATANTDTIVEGGTQINRESVAPNPEGLPGADVALRITGGIVFFSAIMCIVGLVLSAGLWAIGAFSNNYTQSVNGKKGFLICAAAALAIGAAYFLVDWFFGLGQTVGDPAGGGAAG